MFDLFCPKYYLFSRKDIVRTKRRVPVKLWLGRGLFMANREVLLSGNPRLYETL